jgi:hypothetical protein
MLRVALAVSCHLGAALNYQNKTYSDCRVTGSTVGRAAHTYSIQCGDEKKKYQIEYVEGGSSAEVLDMITLKPTAKCNLEAAEVSKMIKTYEDHKHDIENPKCFLSHWKGQVMFHSGDVSGRCSFRMNKDLSDKFESSVKAPASYQCEHEYFLIGPKDDGTAIYKRTKFGWELDCKAPMERGEPENIDWKNNPPAYWEPEEPHVMPK